MSYLELKISAVILAGLAGTLSGAAVAVLAGVRQDGGVARPYVRTVDKLRSLADSLTDIP